MAKSKRKLKIMVGSTVYGFEDQLSKVVAQLQFRGAPKTGGYFKK